MSIGAVGSSSQLTTSLQSAGLSSDKIKLVETDLQQAQQSSGSSSGSSGTDGTTVRAALEKQISADVKSGKLTQDDADKINKALDQMDGTASTDASQGAGKAGGGRPAGGGAGGGGGGGGSQEKTELSRTVTVSGGIKTTVITYTDGTTDTETSVDFSDDGKSSAAKAKTDDARKTDGAAKADKSTKSDGSTPSDAAAAEKTVQDYLSKIEPGSLFDAYA